MSKFYKPHWIRTKASISHLTTIGSIVRKNNLHTVCESAICPNIGECWKKHQVTFMILGSACTRTCTFCNIQTGQPTVANPNEAIAIADAVKSLKLRYVVVTSVDRDDLQDGGASQFANVIRSVRKNTPTAIIEVITPDFRHNQKWGDIVINAQPDIFGHNIETIPRLYPFVRPGARYYVSLKLLDRAKVINKSLFTKSSIMVGLGETSQEVAQVMDDLRSANVDFLTIGQYLQPTQDHSKVIRYVHPSEFSEYVNLAYAKGFSITLGEPLVRSSYRASRTFATFLYKTCV